MHGWRDNVAWKLEARDRQLHIGVREFDYGLEERDRQRPNPQLPQDRIQAAGDWLIDNPVEFFRDGSTFVALRRCRCGRQTGEMRSAVLATAVKKRCAAKNDGRSFRARAEQHRQHAEKHVVADDDIGREVLQSVLQALVLRLDTVDKEPLQGDAYPFRSGRNGPECRSPREDIIRVEIRIRGQRAEFRSAAFDPAAQCGPGQAGDLVAFTHQDARDRK